MIRTFTRAAAVAGAIAVSGAIAPTALAAPISVHIRVEGVTQTLFDGTISTDARSIAGPSSPATMPPVMQHPCDYAHNGMNGGFGPTTGTPTSALYDVAQQLGATFVATWYPSFADFLVSAVGAESSANWGYAVNYTTAPVGGCQFQLAPNSDVVWASDYSIKSHLLKLSGPASANVGAPVTVNVTDGSTGQPIQGASVGGATTDAGGNATLSFPAGGVQSVKAEKSDSVRSAALTICVHNANDGTCGAAGPNGASTAIPTPATVVMASLAPGTDGRRYGRGKGPRVLRGYVHANTALRTVRLRLTRRHAGRCSYYSGRRERFVPARCGRGFFFAVGSSPAFNYLLPTRLRSGHYSLKVEAIALDGSRDVRFQRGRNWSVFDVR